MPGLLGIVSGREPEDLPERLEQMIRPLHRHPWQQVERCVRERAAFAAVRVKEATSFCERDGLLLGVHGEIYNQEALRKKLGGEGLPSPGPAAGNAELPEVLLRLYQSEGPAALAGLSGMYVILVWDEKLSRLTLINDRLGMGRVVYWQAKGRFLFAPEVKCLAAHPRFHRELEELGVKPSVGYLMNVRNTRTAKTEDSHG